MIEIGTVLFPRTPDDPKVEVLGIEGQTYVLTPAENFGGNFALGFDEITARYDCSAYKVGISAESEDSLWKKFSAQRYSDAMRASQIRAAEEAKRRPPMTPEQVFAEPEEDRLKREAREEAEQTATVAARRKLSRA